MRRPSPLRLDSITESPEYEERIDLGAESPASILKPAIEDHDEKNGSGDAWRRAGIAMHTDVPMRRRSWRSASFSEKRKLYGRSLITDPVVVDRDCGICFEVAVVPCRMICCGDVFCLNHISDWLYGSSSDGRCPSCKQLCSFVQDVPSTHPVDAKRKDYTQPCVSKPERFILLLLQPSDTKPSPSPTSCDSIHPNSGSKTEAKPPAPIRTPHGPPRDPALLGPCRFHLNSRLMVLVGRMVGRVLSVVGLTLVLFVLLT